MVERSVNAPSQYKSIADLPANSVGYTDSTAPTNSLLYYRVRAYRDTASSNYGEVALVANGDAPFLMKDSTLITCDKIFMDPGGVDIVPSNINYNTTTFKPAVPGNNISVSFSKLELGGILSVYNGPSANSPKIGELNRFSNPSSVFNSTAADGALTFVYSRYSNNDPGWVARVGCYKPVAKPSGVKAAANLQKVKVTWTDNADDETKYVIERSVNASSLFILVAEISANTTVFTDSTAPPNSLLYYRIRAFRDTLGSLYSDTASVTFGNAPFLMADSTLITCDKVFMDAGGVDVMRGAANSYSIQTTFKPAISGNRIKVAFSKLRINGSLIIYNGSSTNNQIGYLSSYSNPSTVFSSTAEDGSLTIRYSSSYSVDSGWVALVSCYKPVARPSGLNATLNSTNNVRLTWMDNADNETKYVVERSINAPSQYRIIAQLPLNSTEYLDSTAPTNSLVFYRLRAYQDSSIYVVSDTASVEVGQAPYLMKDSTLITCNKVFMDAGGTDIINDYSYSRRTTFKPENSANKIRVAFSNLAIKGILYVYDGLTANGSPIAILDRYFKDRTPVFTATGAEGALTFVYQTFYGYYPDSGWVAQVSCFKTVAKPTELKAQDGSCIVKLNWRDNADDETKYVVERSVNASSLYTTLATLPQNATEYKDSTAPSNSTLFYRVRAYRDTSGSIYSDTATVSTGDAPFLMKDSTLITCEKVFMDPGGVGITSGVYRTITTTFKPGTIGNNIKVAFSKISPYSPLYVYNGSSTNSPFIGSVASGSNRVFYSSATDGSLTFSYYNYGYSDSGWIAGVSCFKRVEAATGLVATADNTNHIRLKWSDNANDETSYVVERSFNDSFHHSQLVTLPPNTTSYIDATSPANSFVFYRVRAMRDTVASAYTNNVSVLNGNEFTMKSGTVSACGITFLDPGGNGNYGNNLRYTTTFTPPTRGSKIKVVFNSFNTESCCDFLNVYNGPDISYPLLGTYLGSTIPKVLESSAPNGELTFVFTSDASTTGTGWKATVECITSNDTLATCSTDVNGVNTLQANVAGSRYQWQILNGRTFENIDDDSNKSGTTTSTLQIKNAALRVLENIRCLVNGNYAVNFVIVKGNRWTGQVSSNWKDSQNWSCGTVPDANTDVLIEGGKTNYPVLNSNVECRSVMILKGASLNIPSGYKLNIWH